MYIYIYMYMLFMLYSIILRLPPRPLGRRRTPARAPRLPVAGSARQIELDMDGQIDDRQTYCRLDR